MPELAAGTRVEFRDAHKRVTLTGFVESFGRSAANPWNVYTVRTDANGTIPSKLVEVHPDRLQAFDPPTLYWVEGDIQVKEEPTTLVGRNKLETARIRERNATRRMKKLPKGIELVEGESLMDWIENNSIQGDSVWCDKCNDHLPGEQLCEHCWWCEQIGWYSTPDEPCECPMVKKCRYES